MKFGLSFLPDANGQDLSAVRYYKTALMLAKLADEAGMNTIKITEHYLHPYGGFCPDPVTFLAAVAACTKNIRLMTGCILPVFHHPVQIAAKTAMLDAISNGRLDVGFARAYLPHEFSTFKISMDGSRDIFEKTIEGVIRLWCKDNVSMLTDYFILNKATSLPKPVQTPHPPIWGAAVMSRQSFSWLGEQGFNLLVTPPLTGLSQLRDKIDIYLETFLSAHPKKTPFITLSMPLLITECQKEAISLGDKYLSKYIDVWANATETWSQYTSTDYPGYTGLGDILRANTPEKMRHHLQALIGSPEFVIEYIQRISEMTTVDQIIWQVDFGAQPHAVSRKTVELFIEKVMPYITNHIKEKNNHAA
jgi:alkanesulfonate monooxygenase SsuD/methylene tetrahydromethanopterin reductase-like flavin-dependent oxidoreductase (luciferase family)